MDDEYRYLRTDFSKRGRMMDEWMDVMQVLWSEDVPSFQGEWISFEESAFEPKPAQKGGPAVYDRRAERCGHSTCGHEGKWLASDPHRAGGGRRRCCQDVRLGERRAAHGHIPRPHRTG